MILPVVNEIATSREMTEVFRGYNHNLRIGDGEFYDMKNLSSNNYPILSQRPKRGTWVTGVNAQGLIGKDGIAYVDGSDFVFSNKRVNMELSTEPDFCPKTLVSMGAYVVILPDKKWINTANTDEWGEIETRYVSGEGETVTFNLCRMDGTGFENTTVSEYEPSDPTNLDFWVDTSTTPPTLKQYSTASSIWVTVINTYIRISAPGIGQDIEKNDGVKISGVTVESLSDLNNTAVVWERGDDFIVITGMLTEVAEQTDPITVAREMPKMDFITESGNRLWGCRYGESADGEVVNEIYASKLGDFKNWNCFMGSSTDSYAASVGTDGPFTGAVTHLGYPLFFKETCLHKVYGSYPAAYQIQTTNCRGIAKGSEKSVATVNEVLYYKSRNGVCAYDGSLPYEISSALGDVTYTDAVGGALGNKYYISMKDAKGKHSLFVYDSARVMWHKEDDTEALSFCNADGELYYIDKKTGDIKTVLGSGEVDSKPTNWMAETGIIGIAQPDKKVLSRLLVRMSLEHGAYAMFYIEYDSSGEFEHLFTMRQSTLDTFTVPIKPKRCDHFRIRMVGVGECNVYSLTKTSERGSDI